MNKKNLSLIVFGILLIILLWQIFAFIINNSIVLPTLDAVFFALKKLLCSKETYIILFLTIVRLLLNIVISFFVALVLAGISLYSKSLEIVMRPFLVIIKTTPVIVIIIILLVIFGSKNTPMLVTTFVLIPIFYEAIINGTKAIDKNILEEVSMHSTFNLTILFKIYIPLIKPYILTSFLQTFGLGLKTLVMSEFIAQPPKSIGYEILRYKTSLDMDYIFGWSIILLIFILLVELILKKMKIQIE